MKYKCVYIFSILIFIGIQYIGAVGDIAIRSVDTVEVKPGEVTQIRIILQNQGDKDIENVAV